MPFKKKFIIFLGLYCSIILLLFFGLLLWQKLKLLNFKNSYSLSPSPSTFPTYSTFPLPKLTLASIFSANHSWVDQLDPHKTITLITTGDVIPARTVNYKMTKYNNFQYPFEKTADFLKNADLTLINLEAPLIKNCPLTNEGMVFCGDQRFIEGLKFADIDVVNLANNHTLNWGIEGISQTINLLRENNILTSGFPINQLIIKEVKGIKIGFLGWNFLEAFEPLEVLETIKQAKNQVNLLIVSAHWGGEYISYPSQTTIDLARQMINEGADLIVGNHPHWLQPIELYQNKLIIYAHGNFIFDQEWSQETKLGMVGKHTFYENKLVDSQFFPIFISDFSQPEFLKDQSKEEVLLNLKNISRR